MIMSNGAFSLAKDTQQRTLKIHRNTQVTDTHFTEPPKERKGGTTLIRHPLRFQGRRKTAKSVLNMKMILLLIAPGVLCPLCR